jgi:ribosomal protein S24E
MYVRKKRNKSGSISVVIVDKSSGRYVEIRTIDISSKATEIDDLVKQGQVWIRKQEGLTYPRLDLFGEESLLKHNELAATEQVLSNISNVLINGTDLILNRVFDRIGFTQVQDKVFRRLVLSRLSYPAGKAATVECLKNHFDEDLDLSRIYRYLDKLGEKQHRQVQRISVEHTRKILGGHIGVMFALLYTAYHNLWNVERAFRIAKSKIEIRPMFHFTRRRIEAHICICFVALKVYKELERILKITETGLSVDKVPAMAKTIKTIQITLPLNRTVLAKTLVMKRHKLIQPLFDDDFWVAH